MHWYLVLKLELDAPVYSEFLGVLVMIVFPINTWIDDLVVCHLTGQRVLGFGITREPKGLLLAQTDCLLRLICKCQDPEGTPRTSAL